MRLRPRGGPQSGSVRSRLTAFHRPKVRQHKPFWPRPQAMSTLVSAQSRSSSALSGERWRTVQPAARAAFSTSRVYSTGSKVVGRFIPFTRNGTLVGECCRIVFNHSLGEGGRSYEKAGRLATAQAEGCYRVSEEAADVFEVTPIHFWAERDCRQGKARRESAGFLRDNVQDSQNIP